MVPKLLGIEELMSKILERCVNEGVIGKTMRGRRLNNCNLDAIMSIFHAQLIGKVSQ